MVLAGVTLALLLTELLLLPPEAPPWLHVSLAATLIVSAAAVILAQRRLRRETECYEAVTRIQREFTDLPSEQIIDHIVQFLSELVPQAEKCVLHMLDEEGKRLYPRYASQRDNGRRRGMPADRGLAGQALKTRRTIMSNSVNEDGDFLPLDPNSQLRSLIVGPLYFGGQPLGTISLNSSRRNAFHERDRQILAAFARQASIALRQERLLAARQADHDALAAVTQILDEAFVVLDAQNRIVQHNAALARILGPDMDSLVGEQLAITSQNESVRRLAYIIGDPPSEAGERWEKRVALDEPLSMTLHIHSHKLIPAQGDAQRVILLRDESHAQRAGQEQAAILHTLANELWSEGARALDGRRGMLVRALQAWAQRQKASNGERLLVEAVRLADWIEGLEDRLKRAAAERKVHVSVDAPREVNPDLAITSNLDLIVRLVLDNALQRSHPGDQIDVSLSSSDKQLMIRIADAGCPLEESDRERLLAPHYQSSSQGISGLCIHIARELVRGLGGHLWMPNSPPNTTIFQLALPYLPANEHSVSRLN